MTTSKNKCTDTLFHCVNTLADLQQYVKIVFSILLANIIISLSFDCIATPLIASENHFNDDLECLSLIICFKAFQSQGFSHKN